MPRSNKSARRITSRGQERQRRFASQPSAIPKSKCSTHKRPYSTKIHAEIQLSKIQKSDPKQGERMPCRTYRCPLCNFWHLTSKPNKI